MPIAFDPLLPTIAPGDVTDAIDRIVDDAVSSTDPPQFIVYSIHDGDWIPEHLAHAFDRVAFVRERDFGADAVAAAIQRELGLRSRIGVRLARCLLDVGRFHGIDRGGASHTARLSIPLSVAAALSHDEIAWLAAAYSRIDASIDLDRAMAAPGAVSIGVHTFDPVGADGRTRPELSFLDLPESMAAGDPIVAGYANPELPRAELESTGAPGRLEGMARRLRARGFSVTRNDPYRLPDGAVEVRAHHSARRRGDIVAPHAFVLEVRKDLLFEGAMEHGGFSPRAAIDGAAERIGEAFARALEDAYP